MSNIIETDLKDILSKFDQRFDRLEQRLDRIETDLTTIKIDVATIKVEMGTIKEDVRDLKGRTSAQIWALIGIIFTAVVSAVIRFGFFPKA